MSAPTEDGVLVFPASFAQRQLWLLSQLDPGSPAYNIVCAVRLHGELDASALRRALDEIARRHETLRTAFATVDGQLVQVIAHEGRFPLSYLELAGASGARRANAARLAEQAARTPFDLAQRPLAHALLVREEPWVHLLVITMHHVISDLWSVGVLVRELGALYSAFHRGRSSPLPPLVLQYADYTVWQHRLLQTETADAHLDYWRCKLQGASPSSCLPAAPPGVGGTAADGAHEWIRLPTELARSIERRCAEESVTPFMLLFTAFVVQLHALTRQDDLVIGTGLACRTRLELEPLIGFFVNAVALRVRIRPGMSTRELLRQVRETCLEAYAHQEVPFDRVVEAVRPKREPGRSPLFQAVFDLQNVPMPEAALDGLVLEPVEVANGAAKFDLTLLMWQDGGTLCGMLEYRTSLFDRAAARALLTAYEGLLERLAGSQDVSVDALHPVPPTSRRPTAMTQKPTGATFRPSLTDVTPITARVDSTAIVRVSPLRGEDPLPLLAEPAVPHVDLAEWAAANRALIDDHLLRHGAILFRGFGITETEPFERLAQAVCRELCRDNGDHTPVSASGQVQTPVPFPAHKKLLWHNENSFNHRWPIRIVFACSQPAERGGETPLVDSRAVFAELPPHIRDDFLARQVMYVRNYSEGVGLSWQQVFGTESRTEVERRCRQERVEFEWKSGGRLRTRAVRPAAVRHPVSGAWCWTNQAQHWHLACLDPETRDSLLATFDPADLPRTCCFGDGTPIEDSAMESILRTYARLEVAFPWHRGDVVVVDNLLVAHARNPYVGSRRQLVALGDLRSYDEIVVN